jgi:hypothetical protein
VKKATEKRFMATVIAYATLHRWRVFHPFDSRKSTPGWPDLALVKGARLVLAELKTETGRTTAAQEEWLYALQRVAEASGGAVAVHVWTPESWPEIERVLGGAS